MNLTTKRILLAVLVVAVLGAAFFAAYNITLLGEKHTEITSPAASVPADETGEVTARFVQDTTAGGAAADPAAPTTLPGETTSVPETAAAPGETTAAPAATTAAPTTAPAAAPAGSPADTASPTYIGGILVVNKSYPLPRDYNPGGLTSECENAFYEMQSAAEDEGLDLYISSGFRSYDTQASLYQRYCNEDGQAAADTYSARPGHSEHQTGLAIDLNTISSSFAYTAEGEWVAEHCWEYGFILRYPADKVSVTGYMYEPWHIRYVGRDNARAIYNSGLCLEEYLGIDSVYSY